MAASAYFFIKRLHSRCYGYILCSAKHLIAVLKPNIRILQGRVQFPTGGTARERTLF